MTGQGKKAPDFTLPSDQGEEITLSNFLGKKVVLYFYPKDNTPGCTTESIDFNNALEAFSAENTLIFGISKDSLQKHKNFSAKHCFKFPLLSDAESNVCELYGVWKEKSMFGKKYFGIERSTFLIDEHGIIQHTWHKVKVSGHAQDVLEKAKAL